MSLDVYLTVNRCEHCNREDEVFSANITHNLGKMADEAGIYGILWRPEENKISKAKQLIKPLEKAIVKMGKNPDHFKKFDSKNGWGLYVNFLPWLKKYLSACVANPEANVTVSR